MPTSATTPSRKTVLCHLRLHHLVHVQDDNPENRRAAHLECTRCGRIKDIAAYEKSSSTWILKGGPFVGG